MAGFRPTQVVIGIAGELVKGFTTTLTQQRKKPDAINDASSSSSSTASSARRSRRPSARSRGRRASRTSTCASSTVSSWARRSTATRSPTPLASRAGTSRSASSTPSPRSCTSGRSSRSRASSTWSCLEIVAEPYAVARVPRRRAGPPGRSPVRRRRWGHDRRGARPPGRDRGDADVRPRRSRVPPSPSRTGWTCRCPATSFDVAGDLEIEEHDAVGEIVHDAVWAAGVELVMEELAAGEMLPSRIHLCGGGSGCRRSARPSRPSGLLEAAFRSPVRPRSPSWRRQGRSDLGRH